jgi:hypothetical protein
LTAASLVPIPRALDSQAFFFAMRRISPSNRNTARTVFQLTT